MREVVTMKNATRTLTDNLKHYMAHRVRAKIQFVAIEKLKQWILDDIDKRIIIVLDHKQKILPMKYREGQVEYYGKKGMSLLGAMLIEGVLHEDLCVLKYSFEDYVIQLYSDQDHVQVASIVNLILERINEFRPNIREVCLQSDNASCFASQDFIPYIYSLNRRRNIPSIVKWIYTEAQTGRGRLDTHFSYLNIMLKSYIENAGEIVVESDVVKAFSERDGIAGTSIFLVDASKLEGPIINTPFIKKLNKPDTCNAFGVRGTHEDACSLQSLVPILR